MTPHAGVVLLCLVGAAHPAAAMPSAEGRQLAGACAACHQPGAHDAIPSIMGLDEGRAVSMMLSYRSGARQSQVMHVVASALSAEEITAVAHYLAGQQGEQP